MADLNAQYLSLGGEGGLAWQRSSIKEAATHTSYERTTVALCWSHWPAPAGKAEPARRARTTAANEQRPSNAVVLVT